MPIQHGRDMLLKIDPDKSGTFRTLGGLRSQKMSLTTGSVDVTHAQSPEQWRALLEGGGVRTMSVTGSGIFCDLDTDSILLRTVFFEGRLCPWQICLPGFGLIEGLFQLTSLEYTGSYTSEMTYDISLESAGLIIFTPTPQKEITHESL